MSFDERGAAIDRIRARLDTPEIKMSKAHRLALLALQSDRYVQDAEYRDATDDVLAFSFPRQSDTGPHQEEVRK